MGTLISWIKSLFKSTIVKEIIPKSHFNGLVKVIRARHNIKHNKNILSSDIKYIQAYRKLLNTFTIIPNSNIK